MNNRFWKKNLKKKTQTLHQSYINSHIIEKVEQIKQVSEQYCRVQGKTYRIRQTRTS